MKNIREIVLLSLEKSFADGKYSNLEADYIIRKENLEERDRAFFQALYLGVIERKITLDYLIARLSTVPVNKMEDKILVLLEMGLYQLLYMEKIPSRAVLFESGELAKKYSRGAQGLVNGILRTADERRDALFELLNLPGKKGLSLRFSYPRWLVSLWQEAYGKEKCLAILEAQNQKPSLTIRVNETKISTESFLSLLEKEKIPFHISPLAEKAVVIEKGMHPSRLPGYEEGFFFVQDAAAQRAMEKLGAKPQEVILDLCAAPGGKSFTAAIQMENSGRILSFDLHEKRLSHIQGGAEKLGLSIIEAAQKDSAIPDPALFGIADRVICDVPCSGYGVIAKKPDIRLKTKESAALLPEIQKSILECAAQYVKKGGVILYSTCTLNPQENEEITDAFLASRPAFSRKEKSETVFPRGGENDGFFIDLLVRNE